MDVITPGQVAALRDQGYLVVPADCVPASLMHRALDGAIEPAPRRRVLVRQVIQAASTVTGVSVDGLIGPSRAATVVLPRHLAMWVGVKVFHHSLKRTGHAFGDRDHSTVHAALCRVEQYLSDPVSEACTSRTLGLIADEARRMAASQEAR